MNLDQQKKLKFLLLGLNRTKDELSEIYSIIKGTDIKTNIFDHFPEFAHADFVMDLMKDLSFKFVQKGEIIYTQGSPNDHYLYLVLSGELSVFNKQLNKPKPRLHKSTFATEIKQKAAMITLAKERKTNPKEIQAMFKDRIYLTETSKKSMISQSEKEEKEEINVRSKRKENIQRKGPDSREKVRFEESVLNDDSKGRLKPILNKSKSFFGYMKKFLFLRNSTVDQMKIFKVFEKYYLKDKSNLSNEYLDELGRMYGNEIYQIVPGQTIGFYGFREVGNRSETLIAMKNSQLMAMNCEPYLKLMRNLDKIRSLDFKSVLLKSLKCKFYEIDAQFLNNVTQGVDVI